MENIREQRVLMYLENTGFKRKGRLKELIRLSAISDDSLILERPSYMKEFKKYFTVKNGREIKGTKNWYKPTAMCLEVINQMKEYFINKNPH